MKEYKVKTIMNDEANLMLNKEGTIIVDNDDLRYMPQYAELEKDLNSDAEKGWEFKQFIPTKTNPIILGFIIMERII